MIVCENALLGRLPPRLAEEVCVLLNQCSFKFRSHTQSKQS